ncbi:hypothetical protein CPLU01_11715 [Colletotrichum plurivorum]|uniref:Uncharacterized protein n=1 Tax=Colletotrichum plurivorum TaxID=2175906 RepID=A0A8H6N785_9PEZI|nr:hypothetical protein CPLU01_11715 [Colletotrichum plurivorum]
MTARTFAGTAPSAASIKVKNMANAINARAHVAGKFRRMTAMPKERGSELSSVARDLGRWAWPGGSWRS